MKPWYLAGPMTGIPQFNFPAFDEAAAHLRSHGHEIITPSELDDPETRAKCLASKDGKAFTGSTWGQYLARDVQVVADLCSGIILLEGWQKSRGARLETYVALSCGHRVARYTGDCRLWVGFESIARDILCGYLDLMRLDGYTRQEESYQ